MPTCYVRVALAHQSKLDELRLSVQAGVAALDHGDYTEVDDADLDACLDDIATSAAGDDGVSRAGTAPSPASERRD